MNHRISVVTVVYNAGNIILDTLTSLREQTFKDFELLIIDGKSSDDTLEIVEGMRDSFSSLRILSEPDKGIYDAMNKGIALSEGDYVYFLNAGDVLYDANVFQQVVHFFDGSSVVYGDAYTHSASGGITEYRCGFFTKYRLALTNICHQAIFYPSCILKQECYNLSYRLFADYELNMKLWRKTAFVYSGIPIITYEGGGVSDIEVDKQFRADRRGIVYKYLGIDAWLFIIIKKMCRLIK